MRIGGKGSSSSIFYGMYFAVPHEYLLGLPCLLIMDSDELVLSNSMQKISPPLSSAPLPESMVICPAPIEEREPL